MQAQGQVTISATFINAPESFPTCNKCESLPTTNARETFLSLGTWCVLGIQIFGHLSEKNSTFLSTWHQAARHVCQQPLHCHRLIAPETRNSFRFSIENCKPKNCNTHQYPSDFPHKVYCQLQSFQLDQQCDLAQFPKIGTRSCFSF